MRARLALLLTVAACAACASNPPPPPPAPVYRGPARAAERADDRRDRRVEAHSDWEKLGERWVDGRIDRDVIEVGAREGRFRRIMLSVEQSALDSSTSGRSSATGAYSRRRPA